MSAAEAFMSCFSLKVLISRAGTTTAGGRFRVRLLRDDVLLKDNERFRERDSFKYSFCSYRRIAQCDYR